MIPTFRRACIVCAVLLWAALPQSARAQMAFTDASQADSLQPLLLPRFPQAVAPAQAPDELPPPRVAPPSPPLEVIDFRDLPLSDAMRLLSQQTGLNIVPSAEA